MTSGNGDASDKAQDPGHSTEAPSCPASPTAKATKARATPYSSSLFTELRLLSDGIWFSPEGKVIAWLFGTILLVIIGNMVGQVGLNRWNGDFFDAIGRKDTAGIKQALVLFLGIVSFLLVMVVAQTWLQETIKLRGREWLTNHLFDSWLVNGRPYRLEASSDVSANPDQRMQEDARRLSELSTGLGIGFVQNVFLLMTFISVLWQLSSNVKFDIGSLHVAIPGYMVWCALVYALVGSFLTWLVGRRLIGLDASRYAREAELRYRLVRVNERAEAVSLSRGEQHERKTLDKALDDVLQVTRQYIFALARLTWITSGYGWLALVVPAIVALPGYLQGQLTLGGLMMVIGAFNQVQGGLRWFVDNAAAISDWRATLFRVAVFAQALEEIDDVHANLEQIRVEPHPDGNLAFEHLTVLNAFGKVVIDDANMEITAGEHVLIVGDAGAGKSTLMRAMSGLWLCGHGRILVPPREQMVFMPQNPYLPLGTLQAAVCYPYPADHFSRDESKAAFASVGLRELEDSLDADERWDRLLSQGQLQLLAFARLLLHKPKWVFLDEATSGLDHDSQARVMQLFDNQLKGTTVVSIGHRSSLAQFHQRQLQLKVSPDGAHLGPRQRNRPSSALLERLTSWFGQAYSTFISARLKPQQAGKNIDKSTDKSSTRNPDEVK